MRAVLTGDYGARPEIRDIPEPEPGPGEVKIRVRAASLNGFDPMVANGCLKGMMAHRFPVVLGRDYAGTITEIGPAVAGFMPGEEVFGVVLKPTLGDGTFGEYVTVPAGIGLAPLIADLDHATAGVLGLAGSAALAAVDAVAPKDGELVLVSGATGGVGGYAVQLAAARGATVIATARPGAAAEQVTALGARHTVDHHGDLADQVRRVAPKGVDAVLHLAGDPIMLASLLTRGGRFASTLGGGPSHLGDPTAAVTAVNALPDRELLDRLATAITSGQLTAPVVRAYRLPDVPRAFEDFDRPGTVGKLAVTIP